MAAAIVSSRKQQSDLRVLLFAEIKQLLSAVQFVIENKSSQNDKVTEVTFTQSSVIVRLGSSFEVTFTLLAMELSPNLCNGLINLPNGELHLRVQASGELIRDVYYQQCERNQQYLTATFFQQYKSSSCAFCNSKFLLQSKNFKRVLPLPSDDWTDLSDIWFCHQTCSHHKNGFIPQPAPDCSIKPRESDCLIGDLYLLIHISYIDETKCIWTKKKDLLCSRCHTLIGSIWKPRHSKDKIKSVQSSNNADIVKIWWHALSFEPQKPSSSLPAQLHVPYPTVEQFLVRFLIDQSHSYTCFRFILQSRENGLERLSSLVWLLDTDALLYQSCVNSQANQDHNLQNKPEPEIEADTPIDTQESNSESEEPKSDSEPIKSVDTQTNTNSYTVEVKSKRIVKLLYQVFVKSYFASDQSQLTAWHCDQSVTLLTLPYNLHLYLLDILLNNTSQIPRSLRYLNMFHVGYLHKDQQSFS